MRSGPTAHSLRSRIVGSLLNAAPNTYAWRTVATLIRPGFEADQWVGNARVTTPEYEKNHLSRR